MIQLRACSARHLSAACNPHIAHRQRGPWLHNIRPLSANVLAPLQYTYASVSVQPPKPFSQPVLPMLGIRE